MDELLNELAQHQAQSGAFLSYILLPDALMPDAVGMNGAGVNGAGVNGAGHEVADENGFATALVLRELRQMRQMEGPGAAAGESPLVKGALDFLERCESPEQAGAFAFWPVQPRPAWAKNIPADLDDTATINLELVAYGRRPPAEGRRVVYEVLIPHLVQGQVSANSPKTPPWLRRLVFPTWIGHGNHQGGNPVDCCVNANVVALMAYAGLARLPGYRQACAMIEEAIGWAGTSPARMRSLTPYYPQPIEFLHALDHAIACGVVELEQARAQLARNCAGLVMPGSPPQAIFSNAYGGAIWHSPALALLRSPA